MQPNLIIMLDGINMLVGICISENEIGMLDVRNLQNFKPLITHRISCEYLPILLKSHSKFDHWVFFSIFT